MNFPTDYHTDGSYVEVNDPQMGDIICYYSNGSRTHSGIIVNYTPSTETLSPLDIAGNLEQFTVQSKWGSFPLFEHSGNDCEYGTNVTNDPATSYKIFRRANHTHTFTTVYQSGSLHDYSYCTGCGVKIYHEIIHGITAQGVLTHICEWCNYQDASCQATYSANETTHAISCHIYRNGY